jgi:hypothetical protein
MDPNATFKEHDVNNMELQLNEDGKYVYIVQNDQDLILDTKIKVWDVMTL